MKITKKFENRLLDTMQRTTDVGRRKILYGLPIELKDTPQIKFPIHISKGKFYWEVSYPRTKFRIFHKHLHRAMSLMIQELLNNERNLREVEKLKGGHNEDIQV